VLQPSHAWGKYCWERRLAVASERRRWASKIIARLLRGSLEVDGEKCGLAQCAGSPCVDVIDGRDGAYYPKAADC